MTNSHRPRKDLPQPPEAKPATACPPAVAGTNSGRAVPEWKGKTPDSKIPPHVRVRVFQAYDGRCYLTGRKIMPADYWEVDHITAMINGGENVESNLAPVLRDAHKIKTKADVREKSKVARLRKRHLGIKKDRTITRWLNMRGELVIASKSR